MRSWKEDTDGQSQGVHYNTQLSLVLQLDFLVNRKDTQRGLKKHKCLSGQMSALNAIDNLELQQLGEPCHVNVLLLHTFLCI